MSAPSPDYLAFVLELLEPIHEITSGRFFGGTALSSGAAQFAMIMGNTLYFAVDDATRAKYQAMGSTCFSYATKKRRVDVTRYYEVPGDLFEDRDQLLALARESIVTAERIKHASKPRKAK